VSEERLQRILARAGIASRRKAEELIRDGRVTVNGEVVEIGSKADPEHDAIKLDGKRVQPHTGGFHYLLLNKPKGVMSTVADPGERPTVMDYVPATLRKALVPVGRLDFNTEGLLILTDDGEFAQHVAHPRYGGIKVYEVKVKGRPAEPQLEKLRTGIPIDGRRTSPCRITARYAEGSKQRRVARKRAAEEGEGENSWWTVELTEGRTRQIREMFFRIGHPVQKLRRVAIGPLRDPNLPVGDLRELSEAEVEKLRRVTARPKKTSLAPAPPAARKPPAVKRAPAVAPGPKKDRSRPWRAEKPAASAPASTPAAKPKSKQKSAPKAKPPSKPRPKPGKKSSRRPAGKSSAKPAGTRGGRGRRPGGARPARPQGRSGPRRGR
jgi:23S rRNA pseudouridine2605 synthase